MAIVGFVKVVVHFQTQNAKMKTMASNQRELTNANLCVKTTDATAPKIAMLDTKILQLSAISKKIEEDIARFVVNILMDVSMKQQGSLTKKGSLSVSTAVSSKPAKALASALRRAFAILRTTVRAFVHTVLMSMIARNRPS